MYSNKYDKIKGRWSGKTYTLLKKLCDENQPRFGMRAAGSQTAAIYVTGWTLHAVTALLTEGLHVC